MAGEDFSQRASHDRLSAITDGVYAVALTLLALEIVVPSANSIHSSAQLNDYMVNNLLPQLSLYLISFIILSNFWASTNAIPMYKKVDNTILTINLAILALVVLIPFSTSFVLSFYHYSQSVIIFSLIILLVGLLYLILYIYLFKENLVKERIYKFIEPHKRIMLIELSIPPVLALISIVLALFNPLAGMYVYVIVLFATIIKKIAKRFIKN
ncbi:TMEM175 family protein [uncultured Methanobrevibacter sp.]|uniref:TMEM175 family protein n=1 Tax=uncultured Methanobrevibacter sp. TaxID=253161 RepID=UPI00259A7563|nr:TMEM175 family protein [uncultured Methanobrevibacter sp.]